MKEVMFLNGRFLPVKEAKVSALSLGLLAGRGLFETMRSLDKRIIYFDQHLERIRLCAKKINLAFPFSLSRLKSVIKMTVVQNAIRDAYVRLTLWGSKGRTDISVVARKYAPHPASKYKTGFRLSVSTFKQNENSLLSKVKTTNRLFYELALREANQRGFDEALILNSRGFIAETSRSNIFLVKDKAVFTPLLSCGCLDGITRKVVLDLSRKSGIAAAERDLTLQDLYHCDEAFLTNSLIGILPLTRVEDNRIGEGKTGMITQFFIKKYKTLFKK